jgi:hypothetical protein
MRSVTRCALVVLASMAGLAAPAEAGQYQLHSCRLPGGAFSPLVDWVPNGGIDGRYVRGDWCVSLGYFDVQMLPGSTQTGDGGRHWRLVLPAAVRLRRMRGQFAATTRPGGHVVDVIAGNGLGNLSFGFGMDRGSLARWNDPSNAFDTGDFTATATYLFGTRCAGGAVCGPLTGSEAKSHLRVFRAQATLEDISLPTVDLLRGRLTESTVHRGIEGFTIDASDTGAGVYRLIVELNGVERLSEVLDPSAGQCADQVPGNGTDYDFTTATPCLPTVSGSRTLDTRLLPDGNHTVRLIVEDAAGNRRVAYGPRTGWRVDNSVARIPPAAGLTPRPPAARAPLATPVPNGTPATERSRLDLFFAAPKTRRVCRLVIDSHFRTRRRCRRVRSGESVRRGAVLATPYGRRVRLRGRLMTLDGRPIRRARLHLRRLRRGARRPLERFDVRTDRNGRFHTTIGRSPSERIRAVYYPTSTTRRPVISRVLIRRVPAGVRLHGRRRGVGLALQGRLLGGSRPATGVRVRAELRLRGSWALLGERRVRRASFVIRRKVRPRGVLRVRLRVLRSRGYPYEPSTSRTVRLPSRP